MYRPLQQCRCNFEWRYRNRNAKLPHDNACTSELGLTYRLFSTISSKHLSAETHRKLKLFGFTHAAEGTV